MNIGEKIQDFCLPDQQDNETCMSDMRGKWTVLYFYPKNDTKGCTLEALDFTKHSKDFANMNTTIVGISPDSTESHQKFMKKHGLKIKLLSDPNNKIIKKFGAWQKKHMYGKEIMGVQRSTFILDPYGRIMHKWPKVTVDGHAKEVKEKLHELMS